jgi:hypothetical protein
MPNEERIDDLIDIVKIQQQADVLDKILSTLETRLNDLNQQKANLNISDNSSDVIKNVNGATQALKEFTFTSQEATTQAKLQTEASKQSAAAMLANAKAATEAEKADAIRAKSLTESAKAQTENAKAETELAKQRKIQADIDLKYQKQNDLTVKQIVKEEKAVADLSNDYKQLSIAYNEAALKAKNLQLISPGSQAAKDAATEAKKLGDLLKNVDASVGQNQRNVGNYFGAIQNAFSKTFGFFRTVANILPGLGLSGLFLGIYEGIKLIAESGGLEALVHNIFNIKDAYQELVDKRTLLNEVQAEANKTAAKEIIDARLLYESATNVSLSIKDRTAAVKALKTEFPDYFKGIDTETILNGNAKKSYDELIISIEKAARATAAKGKLDQIEAQRLDVEFQRQKIRNAVAQEQANAKDKNLGQEGGGFEKGTGTKSVIYTAAEQKADAERRKKRALDEQNDIDARLKRQEDFLVKFAGGENQIAKTIETAQSKAEKKGPKPTNKDYYIDALKAQEEAKVAQLEIQRDLYDSLAKDDKQNYLTRIGNLKSYVAVSLQILEEQKKFALLISEAKTKEELNKENLTDKQIADIRASGNDERIKIEADYLKKVNKLTLDNAKEQENLQIQESKRLLETAEKTLLEKQRMEAEARAKGVASDLQFISEVGELRLNQSVRQFNTEQSALIDQYQKGKVSKEEYEKELLRLQTKYAKLRLQLELEVAQAQLQKLDPGDAQYDKVVTQISNIQEKLKEIGKKSDDDSKDQLLKTLQEIKQISDSVANAIQGVVDVVYERQKAAIQDQINLIDKQKNKELAANDATAQSAQDKANNIAIIEARAQAKREDLERRQKEIDNKKAKADRAFQIFNIIGNTAIAVTKFLAEGNIPASIAAGAVGALEIATVLATPLPKYKYGTKDHTGSPFAVVGDGGKREVIVTPTGQTYVTPAKDTVVAMPEHSMVFPSIEDYQKGLQNAAINATIKMGGKDVSPSDFDRSYINVLESKLDQTNFELRTMQNAIKNIPLQVFKLDQNGLSKYIQEGVNRTEYINRYFKT